MIVRPVTLVAVLGACTVGLGLYLVTYEVQDLKDDLSVVNRDIAAERESIHVLNAEWSLLNDPARLRRLAERYLGLEPVEPDQIHPFDDLPFRPTDPTPIAADPPGDTPAATAEPVKEVLP